MPEFYAEESYLYLSVADHICSNKTTILSSCYKYYKDV